MSEPPKFEVIDRRKMKAEEEKESGQAPAPAAPPAPPPTPSTPGEPAPGPRLVVNEPRRDAATEEPVPFLEEQELADALPPPPTAQESHEQKAAYDASAQRLEDLIRAQNPAVGPQPAMGFAHLVQQFYVTAMLQMGAATQEGQQPRIDIMGARATIDLMGILAEKTRGNLSEAEDRMVQSVLFEARMAFLELTRMMTVQKAPPPPPPVKK
jgi:hypothetical protein